MLQQRRRETPCIYVWLCSFSLWICRRARSLYLSLSDAAVIACEFHRLTDTRSSSIYGSICVYDLSVSIRYACGTFIIFSMRCTLAANADSVAIRYISADVSLHRLHSAHFIFCLHLIHSTACIFGFSSVWLCVPTHERCIRYICDDRFKNHRSDWAIFNWDRFFANVCNVFINLFHLENRRWRRNNNNNSINIKVASLPCSLQTCLLIIDCCCCCCCRHAHKRLKNQNTGD